MSAETCRRGHPRTAENIRVSKSDGRRRCRACEAVYSRKYWAAHKREPRPRRTAADMAEDFEWLYLTNYGGQLKPAEWTKEAHIEADNDDALVGIVVAKRRGTSNPGEQWVLMTLADLVALLTGENPEVE